MNHIRLSILLFTLQKGNYNAKRKKNSKFTYLVKKSSFCFTIKKKKYATKVYYGRCSWCALQMPKWNCIPACGKDEGGPRNSKGLIMRGRVGIRMNVNPRIVFIKSNAIL